MSRYDGARGAGGLRQEDWGTRIVPRGTGGLRKGNWVRRDRTKGTSGTGTFGHSEAKARRQAHGRTGKLDQCEQMR
jgi:hypothetical protein